MQIKFIINQETQKPQNNGTQFKFHQSFQAEQQQQKILDKQFLNSKINGALEGKDQVQFSNQQNDFKVLQESSNNCIIFSNDQNAQSPQQTQIVQNNNEFFQLQNQQQQSQYHNSQFQQLPINNNGFSSNLQFNSGQQQPIQQQSNLNYQVIQHALSSSTLQENFNNLMAKSKASSQPITIQNNNYNITNSGQNNYQSYNQSINNNLSNIQQSSQQQFNVINFDAYKELEEKSIEKSFTYQELLSMLPSFRFGSDVKKKILDECIRLMTQQLQQLLNQTVTINKLFKSLSFPQYKNYYMDQKNTEDTYQYDIESNQNQVVWHVNFADNELFGFCFTPLFAQDEIQCAEHPFLYTVRSAMLSQKVQDFTPKTTQFKQPTPILLYNIPHQVRFDLSPSPVAPRGIYGNNFQGSSYNTIRQKTNVFGIDRPKTNLIAMAALQHGQGAYTIQQIQETFLTAFLAFRQAKIFSQRQTQNKNVEVIIHTGNWGCGAFGNNMELIAIVQKLAAKIAQVDELHYHTFNAQGTAAYNKAKETYRSIERYIDSSQPIEQVVNKWIIEIENRKYKWGVSDNN